MGAELQQHEALAGELSDELVLKARRTVAAYAEDAEDAAKLLAMLGLVDRPSEPRKICGTWQGRNRHVQLGELVCEPCWKANEAHLADLAEKRGDS